MLMKKQEKGTGQREQKEADEERKITMKGWREAKEENGVKGNKERGCGTSEH
jgi:hypothetical protein